MYYIQLLAEELSIVKSLSDKIHENALNYSGKIAFITQSGALGIGLMGWTAMKKIGLAALVSIGNKADIDEQDLITYFNKDENVNVLLIYMEGIKDGAKFLRSKIPKGWISCAIL